MPGLTTTHCECNDAILASLSFPMLDELCQNLKVVHARFASKSVTLIGHVLMVDEIKVEQALCWCPANNAIIGLCWEHSEGHTLTFDHLDDANVVCEDLANNIVHVGMEVSQVNKTSQFSQLTFGHMCL